MSYFLETIGTAGATGADGPPKTVGSLNAAGSTAGDATLLSNDNNNVNNVDGTTGVILDGTKSYCAVYNGAFAATLKVYPNSSGTINSTSGAYSIGPHVAVLFFRTGTSSWGAVKSA